MESCSWKIFGCDSSAAQPELNEIWPKYVIVVEAYAHGGPLAPPRGLIVDDDASATPSSVAPQKGGGRFWQEKYRHRLIKGETCSTTKTRTLRREASGEVFGRLMHRNARGAGPPTPPAEPGPRYAK